MNWVCVNYLPIEYFFNDKVMNMELKIQNCVLCYEKWKHYYWIFLDSFENQVKLEMGHKY